MSIYVKGYSYRAQIMGQINFYLLFDKLQSAFDPFLSNSLRVDGPTLAIISTTLPCNKYPSPAVAKIYLLAASYRASLKTSDVTSRCNLEVSILLPNFAQ